MNKKVERSLIFQQFSVEDAAIFFVEKLVLEGDYRKMKKEKNLVPPSEVVYEVVGGNQNYRQSKRMKFW